jgi:hypothetical protein
VFSAALPQGGKRPEEKGERSISDLVSCYQWCVVKIECYWKSSWLINSWGEWLTRLHLFSSVHILLSRQWCFVCINPLTRCRPFFNDSYWAHPAWISTAALKR